MKHLGYNRDIMRQTACLVVNTIAVNSYVLLIMQGGGSGLRVHKKAIIRNRYNRIPHSAQNTKRERDTYNEDGTKIKTTHVKSQGDSSFPTDGHKAILNKLSSKSKTNRKWTNIDN